MSPVQLQPVDVAVALIKHRGCVLAVYNPKWGSFTLPMTKRRQEHEDPAVHRPKPEEGWTDAAIRAASEWLGRTMTAEPEFLCDIPKFDQTDHDGVWRRYSMKVFVLALEAEPDLAHGANTEWLTLEDLADEKRRPISPTARRVASELTKEGNG